MRKKIYVSSLLCRTLVYLIRPIDKGIEALHLASSLGHITQDEYYAVSISWYDMLNEISDRVHEYAKELCLTQGKKHSKHMLRAIRERKKGMMYEVPINTEIGQQCFEVFAALDTLLCAVVSLRLYSNIETNSLILCTQFGGETLSKIQLANKELQKVVHNAQQSY